MEKAMDIIVARLKVAGLNEREIYHLLAQFLEEEAYDFVEAMNALEDDELAYVDYYDKYVS
ncbi:MAG: hypothetical protein IJI66_02910 [Erysipelotrichaceae bacterium]|nr:hypothetical protein [Erysipelotrichaceae bacterium]